MISLSFSTTRRMALCVFTKHLLIYLAKIFPHLKLAVILLTQRLVWRALIGKTEKLIGRVQKGLKP
jgi:hypothetical protein